MCVMAGGLGRAVSVSTLATAEAAPDFLAVKAATVSEYAVAGSGEEEDVECVSPLLIRTH